MMSKHVSILNRSRGPTNSNGCAPDDPAHWLPCHGSQHDGAALCRTPCPHPAPSPGLLHRTAPAFGTQGAVLHQCQSACRSLHHWRLRSTCTQQHACQRIHD